MFWLFFLGVLFFIFAIVYFSIPTPRNKEDIPLDLKTGDLVFMSGNSVSEAIIRLFVRCEYSHVGMIFVSEGKTYVWEADVGQGKKEGPRLIEFDDKVLAFHKRSQYPIFVRRYTGPRIEDESMLKIIEKYVNKPMSFAGWIYSDGPEETEGVCCSTLIGFTLRELGLFAGNPNFLSPRDLLVNFPDIYE